MPKFLLLLQKKNVSFSIKLINFKESVDLQCKQKNCALGETIIDPSCAQIGTKCGTNMIFQIADKLKSFNSTALLTKCILRCDCDSGNFIEKNGQCMKVFDEPNTTLSNLLTASKRDVSFCMFIQFACLFNSDQAKAKVENAYFFLLMHDHS